MSLIDPVAGAFTQIRNAANSAQQELTIQQGSNFLGELLKLMKENEYIEDYSREQEKNVAKFKVKLNGKINDCKAIKPRYAVTKDEYEKFEKRYLPARDVGLIIVSTSQGIMTHKDAKQKKIGGRLIAYLY